MSKNIGIIGSGVVAQSLGEGFIKYGYQVMLGTRDTSKLAEWLDGGGQGASIGSFSDAAAFGDIIVLATKGTAASAALELAGTDNLSGKTVIDATNPIKDEPPVNGVLKFFTTFEESLMEQLQSAYPATKFVKAFNSVGSALMVNPSYTSNPTMFICGNDEAAKKEVSEILDLFGWETADFGLVESARAIEPLCMLWCIPGIAKNEWTHAFKLLTK
jgi:predicted dinucleotide-binding enzyme